MDANISGESNLQILLQSASPQHNPGKYVFCTLQQPAPALLTAAFAHALAQQNISCNVIAGYYHDHIFVADDNVQQALVILNNLGQAS